MRAPADQKIGGAVGNERKACQGFRHFPAPTPTNQRAAPMPELQS